MKTIEERAKLAETNMPKTTSPFVMFRAGYIRGATEQKAIDEDVMGATDALQTTHTPKGVTKKELLELLKNYPNDAIVVVECCNVRKLCYNEKDNTIRID